MDKSKIIAALMCFLYLVCVAGPCVILARSGRGAFALLVLGLAAFGWRSVKPYFKHLAE